MRCLVLAARFQYIKKTNNITVNISLRMRYAVAHTGLSCQMNNGMNRVVLHYFFYCCKILKVDLIKVKILMVL